MPIEYLHFESFTHLYETHALMTGVDVNRPDTYRTHMTLLDNQSLLPLMVRYSWSGGLTAQYSES